MMEVSEIFYSLQGEGPFAGRPAVFIRLSGCVPPFCPWCDTAYAREKGEKMEVEEILNRALAFKNDLVVITGGEPFLQWNSGLKTLDHGLLDAGCSIQYETSGKVPIPKSAGGVKVCSPKFLEGMWRFVPENVHGADAFKFVVKDDFQPVEAFIDEYGIPRKKIWIMPLGATRGDQIELFPSVWEFCVQKGFNFSSRLHILAFNNKPGV